MNYENEYETLSSIENKLLNKPTLLEQAKKQYKIIGSTLVVDNSLVEYLSFQALIVFAAIPIEIRESIKEIRFDEGVSKTKMFFGYYDCYRLKLKDFFPNAKIVQVFGVIGFDDTPFEGLGYTLHVQNHKSLTFNLQLYKHIKKITMNLESDDFSRIDYNYPYFNRIDYTLYYDGIGNLMFEDWRGKDSYDAFINGRVKFVDKRSKKAYSCDIFDKLQSNQQQVSVIAYNNYYSLININFKNPKHYFFLGFDKVMLVGPKLSIIEQKMAKQEISKKFNVPPKKIYFTGVETTLDEDDLPELKKEEKKDFTDANIIESLVNQINEISSSLSDEFKDKINKILNNIIDEYKKLLASDKEKYSSYIEKSNDENIDVDSYSSSKEYLEKSLTDLLESLKKFKEFYEVSLEINENSHLISKENILSLREKYRNGEEVELPKEMVSMKEMLAGIAIYLSKMDENITREYIDKINKILQVPREKFIEFTEKNLDDELLLTLYGNPKTSIILELDSIYKEIVKLYIKNQNYYELYNTLSSRKEAKEFTKGISNEIEVIRGVLSELIKNNFGIELKEKFDLLFERYKLILEDNFNKNDLSNERFKEIEHTLREELQPLLLSLNKEANRYRNGSSLIEELERVDSVVKKNEIEIIENDSAIISYVKQMLSEIDKSTLNEKEKIGLRRQIISFKNNEKKKLDNITSKEDFIRLKTEITVEFSKMFTTLCKRIINIEKYNEHINTSNDILGVLESNISK